MNIRAAEVRECLRDEDLLALERENDAAVWRRMAIHVGETWAGDLSEKVMLHAGEIASHAVRRWPGARHSAEVMDGVLPATVLATAIVEALSGIPDGPMGAALERRISGGDRSQMSAAALRHVLSESKKDDRSVALSLAHSFFESVGLKNIQDHGLPRSRQLEKLAHGIVDLRWVRDRRSRALVSDGQALALRAGEAILGAPSVHAELESEENDEGILVLIGGRELLKIPDQILAILAILTPQAAARRLRELAPSDVGHERLASVIELVKTRKQFSSLIGQPSRTISVGDLVHNSRLYDAVPHGLRPPVISVDSRNGREVQATALADGYGAHVGYSALDPLSREFFGQTRRGVYDVDGKLRGRIKEDEAGWRYLHGMPSGGFKTLA